MKILMRQIAADLKAGIWGKRFSYLVICFISMGLTLGFVISAGKLAARGVVDARFSFGDVLCYLFRGMKEYDPSSRLSFAIADAFLSWNLLLAFVIGSYSADSLKTTGKNMIVRAGSRGRWWIGKCVWCAASVFVFYLAVYLGIVLGALLSHFFPEPVQWRFAGLNGKLFQKYLEAEPANGIWPFLLFKMMVLPMLASLAISVMQMVMTFMVRGVAGYMAVIAICGFSAYYMNALLPGNAMMLYRYCEVNPDGIGMLLPAAACAAYLAIGALAGYWWFENKDIY